MKITTYKYEKVAVSDTEIVIPETPLYCFETGIRRAIRIIPLWTEWLVRQGKEKEEIYSLEVTCLYGSSECVIEKFSIPISQIETIFATTDKSKKKSIVELLLNQDYNIRTKEQFEADLTSMLNGIIKK